MDSYIRIRGTDGTHAALLEPLDGVLAGGQDTAAAHDLQDRL
ncbi:hypothetical protein ACQEV9_30195 [Streptomyces chartreusis]